MNKYYIKNGCDTPLVVALGFFDCIHRGHLAVIREAKKIAERLGAECAVLTFANDPNLLFGKKPQIYSMVEREVVLENLGVQNLIYLYLNENTMGASPEFSLQTLLENFNVKCVVAGKDYTFGKDGAGNTDFLKSYLTERGIKVKIIAFEKMNGKKISTTMLKNKLEEGNIGELNAGLSQPYFVIGKIIHQNHRGSILGFPTANLEVNPDCIKLGSGIYATKVYIDGKVYIGTTNVGAKLTFGETNYTNETYIHDFNSDIYGKTIMVEFHKRLRSIVKFPSISAFRNQLNRDIAETRAVFNL